MQTSKCVFSAAALLLFVAIVSCETETKQPTVTCLTVKCIRGSTCRMVDGRPKCLPAQEEPQDDDDEHQQVNPCAYTTCAEGTTCVEEDKKAVCKPNSAAANCPVGCPKNLAPVCGSDGKTYSNSCLLKAAACEQKRDISVASKGQCEKKECPQIYCFIAIQPVCGSDGVTYQNSCELLMEQCRRGGFLELAYNGKCREKSC